MSEPYKVFQTAGPLSVKFGRKAQLNPMGKIAKVYISNPTPGGGELKTLKAEGILFTKQKMFKFHPGNAGHPQLVVNKKKQGKASFLFTTTLSIFKLFKEKRPHRL